MKKKVIFLLSMACFMPLAGLSQKVNPLAYYYDSKEMTTVETTSIEDGEAPLDVTFRANPEDMGDYTPSYEWHFRRQNQNQGYVELFVRYEEETQYTFAESGTYNIVLKTILDNNGAELDSVTLTVTIPESRLEFPNAFSPNGDGINDIYQAKEGYRSIVKFHAYILNRWGQKLYEWTDPASGWDGTYKGKDVKDGTYFVLVKATGADGREYNIRKDVNLRRKYTQGGTTTGGGNE